MAKTAKKKPRRPELARAPAQVRLDLGAGQSPAEGFEGVDLNAPAAKHRVDLFKFPWPFRDNSVDELHSSHFIEHIPLRDVEEQDIVKIATSQERARLVGKDMLFAFFDECWRILKHDGGMKLIWPALRSNRAFQDPTHRRFIPAETMMYLDPGWRKINRLDHYRVDCHFIGTTAHSFNVEEQCFSAEVQAMRFGQYWNTILDFHATMKAQKR